MANEKQQKQKFDVERLVADDYGLDTTIDSMNPDGTVSLTLADGRKPKLNIHQMLKDDGVDPNSVDFVLNSPGTAKGENALGFEDQMKFIAASTPKQKLGFLQRQYGADNVLKEADDSFKVKDNDGFWKKADSAWHNDLLGSIPSMAGSTVGTIAGAKAGAMTGAALGSVVPVIGTAAGGIAGAVLGGVLGGATGTTLARLGENKAAEAMGIRTEEDLGQMKDELGREFANSVIWDTVTLGAGKVLKSMAPAMKGAVADTLGALVKGTDGADWRYIMDDATKATRVKALISGDAKAMTKNLAEKVEGTLPTSNKIADIVVDNVQKAKVLAERSYKTSMDELDAAGAFKGISKPLTEVRDNMFKSLQDLGLINMNGSGKLLTKSSSDILKDSIERNPAAIKEMTSLAKYIDEITNESSIGNIKASDLLNIKKRLSQSHQLLTSSINPAERSSVSARILAEGMNNIDNAISSTVGQSKTLLNGKPLKQVLDETNKNYAKYASSYSVISDKVKDFGDINAIRSAVQTMDKEKGAEFFNAFRELASSSGSVNATKALGELEELMVAKNLSSNTYAKGLGALPAIALRASAQNVSRGVVIPARQTKTALSNAAGAVGKYTGLAKATNFLRNLPTDQRVKLMNDNQLMSQFMQSITGYEPMKQQAEQELMSQVPK